MVGPEARARPVRVSPAAAGRQRDQQPGGSPRRPEGPAGGPAAQERRRRGAGQPLEEHNPPPATRTMARTKQTEGPSSEPLDPLLFEELDATPPPAAEAEPPPRAKKKAKVAPGPARPTAAVVRVAGSRPYAWPYDAGGLAKGRVALVLIDMQTDFVGPGGYVDKMGYDLAAMRRPVAPLRAALEAARAAGVKVVHTREGHRRGTLGDLPHNKRWRSKAVGAEIGAPGKGAGGGRILTRGEPGWELIAELAPLPGEDVIDKPGKGAFYATDLDLVLRTAGVTHLVLGGVTTDVCVSTTMREANDRGYECLVLEDGTAATDPGNHAAALKMVTMQGGVFGAVGASAAVVEAFAALAAPPAPAPAPAEAEGRRAGRAGVVPDAVPAPFAWAGGDVALVMIDWQWDFVGEDGFGGRLGNDVRVLEPAMQLAADVLQAARVAKVPVVHTLEAHAPDLSDCPPHKLAQAPIIGTVGKNAKYGRALVRGEFGNGLVPMLAALEGEKVVHKPGKGAFYRTDLADHLEGLGVTKLIFTGVTTEVCVQTSMREANDRGYDCLLVSDATASYIEEFKKATVKMITSQGGIVGKAAKAHAVVKALLNPPLSFGKA